MQPGLGVRASKAAALGAKKMKYHTKAKMNYLAVVLLELPETKDKFEAAPTADRPMFTVDEIVKKPLRTPESVLTPATGAQPGSKEGKEQGGA